MAPNAGVARSPRDPGNESGMTHEHTDLPAAHEAHAPSPGRIVILGGGPTGLGAGYRLRQLGYDNFVILERQPFVGGLAHSFTDDHGFTWDVGGHVLFSHYEYYDRLFDELLRDEYSLNERESWIRIAGTWVPYPFQNNIRYLPPEMAAECLIGLIRAQTTRENGRPTRNFAEFIDSVFGEGIARHFMTPYNFKVWAHPTSMMGKDWIGERVAVIDYERAIRNLILQQDDFGWGPNNRFRFPLHGTGQLCDRIAERLKDNIRFGRDVIEVDVDAKVVRCADGSEAPYDTLLSTIPLDVLCAHALRGQVPDHIRHRAAGLLHSGGHMVGVGIRRPCPSRRSWMYFPEDDCPFYRVTYLSNYSPMMTPDKDRFYSLLCETSYSEHKHVDAEAIVEDTLIGLERTGLLRPGEREDVVSIWHYQTPYSYPVPSVDRDERLADVLPWLEERSIFSRGRFGLWKYEVSNTDHSLMQGVEFANRVVLGEPELTIGIHYEVTEDGRREAIHERPRTAGSGEKRLAVQVEVKQGHTTRTRASV